MHVINPASTAINAGDILLTDQKRGVMCHAVRLGQRFRYGRKSPYAIWSHVAIVVEPESGTIVEATKKGVIVGSIATRFPDGDFAIIGTGAHLDRRDTNRILGFLASVMSVKMQKTFKSSFGRAVYLLTATLVCPQSAGTSIASGLVAEAFAHAGVTWRRPPYKMLPADIAKHYDFYKYDN